MDELQARVIRSWQTTIIGLALIALAGFILHQHPDLLKGGAEGLAPLGLFLAGVAAIAYKQKA